MLKAFVLVSLLGVSGDDEISSAEKADAVKMAHLRTFTANAILIPSYQDTEKGLKKFSMPGLKYSPLMLISSTPAEWITLILNKGTSRAKEDTK